MSDPQDELRARFDDRAEDSNNASGSGNTGDTGGASGTGTAGGSGKPGPDPDENATRNQRQVPMYLSDERADLLNALYERLDGRSKVAGEGGIEKHADFMAELVDFAVEHEDELARRLEIDSE